MHITHILGSWSIVYIDNSMPQAGIDPPFAGRNNLLNQKVDALTNQATTATAIQFSYLLNFSLLFKFHFAFFNLKRVPYILKVCENIVIFKISKIALK